MNKLRVLVADDHDEMRWAIVKTLLGHFDVVGAVANGRKLVAAAIELQPDVIVSDVSMPMLTGPEAMKELKSGCHEMPFVLISVDVSCIEQLIEQGAAAFVDKIDIGYELVAAVRSAAAREIYFSNGARTSLLFDSSLQRFSVAQSRYIQ
jgi:DNA-binding NarL/FixJ family response regulator